jgi:RHS repeat-associated protein
MARSTVVRVVPSVCSRLSLAFGVVLVVSLVSAVAAGAAPAVPVPNPITQQSHLPGFRTHDLGLAGYGANSTARGPLGGGFPSKKPIFAAAPMSLAAPASTSAASPSPAASSGAGPRPFGAFPQIGAEIPSYRTAFSDTYAGQGGGYIARIFTKPVNFKASDGSMQPIDDTLVPTTGGFTNRADSQQVFLPAKIASDPVRVSSARGTVSYRLVGARNSTPVVSGAGSFYRDVLPGVSLSYSVAAGTLKESISLASPLTPPVIVFALSLSSGLVPTLDRSGDIRVSDATGQVVYTIPAPSMTDSSKRNVFAIPSPAPVHVALSRAGAGWVMALTPDRAYLDSPKTKFPVVIDPTVYTLAGTACELANGAYANNSYCQLDLTSAGDAGGSPAVTTDTTMQLPLSNTIPADAHVVAAQMDVDVYRKQYAVAMTLNANALTQSFTSSASWNDYDGAHAWTTPGGTYNPTPIASVPVPSSGYMTFPMSALVQSWINGTSPDDGVALTAPGSTNDVALYGTGPVDDTIPATGDIYPPYLEVDYVPELGTPRGSTINQTQLTDTMSLGVNVANGNLLVHNTDLSVTGAGLDQVIDRTYNNLAPSGSGLDFGHGWASSAGRTPDLSGQPDGIALYGTDGSITLFVVTATDGYVTPPGIDATLCSIYTTGGCKGIPAGATFLLTYRNGTSTAFNATGDLISTQDQNSNTLGYQFSGAYGALATDTDTQGRTMSFTDTGTAIPYTTSKIVDNAYTGGRQTSYGYTNGNLTSYVDPNGKTTSYAYDASNNLTMITDPKGNETKLGYTPVGQVDSILRVTNLAAGTGDTTSYNYYQPSHAFPGHASGCPTGLDGTPPYAQTMETDAKGNVTYYCGDTHDRIFFVQDGLGNPQQTTYSSDDAVVKFNDPTTDTFLSSYDSMQRPCAAAEPASLTGRNPATQNADFVSLPAAGANPCNTAQVSTAHNPYYPDYTVDTQGHATKLGYDSKSNLTSITGNAGMGTGVSLNYNSNGTLNWSRDGNGNQTNYGYFAAGDPNGHPGDLKSVTPPAPLGASSYTYDTDSRVHTYTDAKGQTTTYHYDKMDRVTEVDYQDGSSVVITPDDDGNTVKTVDSVNGTSNYTIDAKNRIRSEQLPGQTNSYDYDPNDNLQTLTDASGATTYGYDADNDNTTVLEPGATIPTTITYDPDNRPTCVTSPSGVVTQSTYLPGGELTRTTALKPSATCLTAPGGGNQLTDNKYTYANGTNDTTLRQTLTTLSGPVTTYTYDYLNRLLTATSSSDSRQYTLDPAGNITKRVVNATPTTMAYNAANEICWASNTTSTNGCTTPPSGATTYSFDVDGNELGNSAGLGLAYNARNQTIGITSGGTANPLTYLGGSQNVLTTIGSTSILKNLLGTSGQVTGGQTTSETRDVSGGLLDQRTPMGTDTYLEDGLQSVIGVTSPTGTILDTSTYDPYGQVTASTGTTPDAFTYAGGLQAPGGLTKFGARYYDASLGRWTQQDPAATPSDPVDAYAYASDDPINGTDPTGLYDYTATAKACAEGALQSAIAAAAEPAAPAEGCLVGVGSNFAKQEGCEVCAQAIEDFGDAVDLSAGAKVVTGASDAGKVIKEAASLFGGL